MDKLAVDIGSSFGSPFGVSKGPADLVSLILTGAISLASVIVLFLLILGGIGMIAGAGSNNPQQVESGKKVVTSAVIGFVVVFVAYWIIRFIEVITGVNFVTAPNF